MKIEDLIGHLKDYMFYRVVIINNCDGCKNNYCSQNDHQCCMIEDMHMFREECLIEAWDWVQKQVDKIMEDNRKNDLKFLGQYM